MSHYPTIPSVPDFDASILSEADVLVSELNRVLADTSEATNQRVSISGEVFWRRRFRILRDRITHAEEVTAGLKKDLVKAHSINAKLALEMTQLIAKSTGFDDKVAQIVATHDEALNILRSKICVLINEAKSAQANYDDKIQEYRTSNQKLGLELDRQNRQLAATLAELQEAKNSYAWCLTTLPSKVKSYCLRLMATFLWRVR